jgi:hypothetical protein
MALATHMAFSIAFIIGIVPAWIVLYYILKEYEQYLKDNLLFFSILTGLFLGLMVSFFHLVVSAYMVDPGVGLIVFALVIIAFAIFENLVKIVIVQLKRFEGGFETTYYGTTFGIIVGASVTMGRTYAILSGEVSAIMIVGIFLYALAIILMNGSMGAWLGYGVYKKDLRWSFISTILVSIPFNFIVFVWYFFMMGIELEVTDLLIVGIALAYGVILFIYTYNRILPEALPEKKRRERLREKRKKERE